MREFLSTQKLYEEDYKDEFNPDHECIDLYLTTGLIHFKYTLCLICFCLNGITLVIVATRRLMENTFVQK